MGLSRITVSNAVGSDRCDVGCARSSITCAPLTLLFVRTAWQIEDLCDTERDATQSSLRSLDLETQGIDVWETEVTEDDIDRVLQNMKPPHIYPDQTPDDGPGLQKTAMGPDTHIAAIGLRKLVHHSDCDGSLPPGGAVDVATLFRFIKCAETIPEHEAITALTQCFTNAAEQHLLV